MSDGWLLHSAAIARSFLGCTCPLAIDQAASARTQGHKSELAHSTTLCTLALQHAYQSRPLSLSRDLEREKQRLQAAPGKALLLATVIIRGRKSSAGSTLYQTAVRTLEMDIVKVQHA